jgi:dolichyl-phosphate beta-glucosyltransferase
MSVMEATRLEVSRLYAFQQPSASRLAATDHELTVVIPAFNEERRLPWTLAALEAFLNDWQIDYRVLVVDDGSSDRTSELTDQFGARFSTIRLTEQGGKGRAVRTGMLRATGRVLAFTDADLPYDLKALQRGYDLVRARECEVIFGARDIDESAHVVPRRLARRLATAVFRSVVKCLVSREVTDTQCGLKVFSRKAALELFTRTTIDGFAFDAELVFLTHRLRLAFRRLPVTLINEYSSTISLSRHALPMLLDVLKLRWRACTESRQLKAPLFDEFAEFLREEAPRRSAA